MRLAVYHNLPTGGAKRAAWEYCKRLKAQGHQLHLFGPENPEDPFLSLKPFMDSVTLFPFSYKAGAGPFFQKTWGFLSFLIRLERLNQEIARNINEGNFDAGLIFHCRYSQNPGILPYLRGPYAYYLPEPMREAYEASLQPPLTFGNLPRLVVLAVMKRLDARNARAAQVILTNSYYSRESIYRAYGLNSEVCYLGVDSQLFRPLGLPKKKMVLSVGRVSIAKGYRFLIESLGVVPPGKRPELLIIGDCGDTSEEKTVRGLAAEKGVALTIRYQVDDQELVRCYNEALIVAYCPILEPFGFVPLEAMACGVPVVGVREAGVRESVKDGETGILCDRQAQSFGCAMEALLDDPARRETLGQYGRAHVLKQWDWDQSLERYIRFIEIQRSRHAATLAPSTPS